MPSARTASTTASATVSVKETIDEYLARADWRVNANANQGYSLGGMVLNAAGKLIANYWLDAPPTQEEIAGSADRTREENEPGRKRAGRWVH